MICEQRTLLPRRRSVERALPRENVASKIPPAEDSSAWRISTLGALLGAMSTSSLFVVMGVSGVGKSTLAEALAKRCSGEYLDADAFHPSGNVAKMRSGIPLSDGDRDPWLARLNGELRFRRDRPMPVFLACSALKEEHRRKLGSGLSLEFIQLHASPAAIRERMERRTGHYMPSALLDSQFAILEAPAGALTLDATRPLPELVERVCSAFPELTRFSNPPDRRFTP